MNLLNTMNTVLFRYIQIFVYSIGLTLSRLYISAWYRIEAIVNRLHMLRVRLIRARFCSPYWKMENGKFHYDIYIYCFIRLWLLITRREHRLPTTMTMQIQNIASKFKSLQPYTDRIAADHIPRLVSFILDNHRYSSILRAHNGEIIRQTFVWL